MLGYMIFQKKRIDAGLATISGNLVRQVGKSTITESERKKAFARISPVDDLEKFADFDFNYRIGDGK